MLLQLHEVIAICVQNFRADEPRQTADVRHGATTDRYDVNGDRGKQPQGNCHPMLSQVLISCQPLMQLNVHVHHCVFQHAECSIVRIKLIQCIANLYAMVWVAVASCNFEFSLFLADTVRKAATNIPQEHNGC